MSIILKEIPKDTKIVKAICPNCKRKIHAVGFMEKSKCDGITILCKFCGKAFSVKAE